MSLHPITLNGEDLLIFLGHVDWKDGVTITHRIDAEVEEGLTGLEARSAKFEAMRLELDFTAFVAGVGAAAFRDELKALGPKRIAVPLWPDLLEHADKGQSVYGSPNVVQFDPESSNFAINNPSLVHALRAPLLIGRLADEPEIELLGSRQLSVSLKIVEDSPFDQRISVASESVGSDWPSSLWPDWTKNGAGIQQRVTTQQVGEVRERHVENQESLTRLTQQAQFVLGDRAQIRRLLNFFIARRGRSQSFLMPTFIQGGATNYGRFRFARDGIKLTFTAPGIASASISFTEAPDFAGEVQARPSTAYLFEFTYEVPSPVLYRYTSYEKPLVLNGHTFEPQKIEHGNRKQSTNPAKDELTVTCGEFVDSQGRRNPLWQRVGHGLERRLLLTVWACDPADPAGSARINWRGSCGEVTPTGRLFKAKCIPFAGRLDSMTPATILKSSCNNFFCDRLCDPSGRLRAALLTTGTVAGASGNVLTISGHDHPAGYFAGGWVEVGQGDHHEFRAILNNRVVPGGIELILQRPLRFNHAGETASFLPDCDGQPSRCKAYGNYARFRGFPFIPAENPVLPDSTVNVDYGKK